MSRRERVLAELGLTPLWVRPALLATAAAPEPAAPAHADVAAMPPEPEPARPPAAAAALAAALQHQPPAGAASLPKVPVPASPPVRATTGVQATLALLHEGANARVQDIARQDWATLQQTVADCTACGLCKSRKQAVFGVGNPQAPLLVVGEAPGAEEDKLGEPFVGAAGKLLDNMLAAIGERRGERVFIANVLKCRPPGNRNPQPEEVMQCAPLLARQIELIQPRLIFAVGRFAIQTLLQTDAPVGALRGKMHAVNGIPVVVGYHPAYLLRNLPDKARAWRDLLLLQDRLHALSGPPG
ncbi:uracil-DNA glycosylase [Chitiniphilus purpureus]|uniref:Type-4 uracil-DNA glycosylase n=1 Tax=Chitiniphilus purpureus TaxID=2981137 RepID=A0ABY6DR12_9NEIS|nr:uracil-DNA glycosylase [Chitiniphilus sp. CD1]UXY16762.1 uracil-DNA glycosylase [Chitiniphilus sp. CD1]